MLLTVAVFIAVLLSINMFGQVGPEDKIIYVTGQITNLMGRKIQQHIFGDLIDRRASLALTYRWDGAGNFPAGAN